MHFEDNTDFQPVKGAKEMGRIQLQFTQLTEKTESKRNDRNASIFVVFRRCLKLLFVLR